MWDKFIAWLNKHIGWGLLLLIILVHSGVIAVLSAAFICASLNLPNDAYIWVAVLVLFAIWAFILAHNFGGTKKKGPTLPISRSEIQEPAEPPEIRKPTETETTSPEKVRWNEVEESSQENRRIIQLIENISHEGANYKGTISNDRKSATEQDTKNQHNDLFDGEEKVPSIDDAVTILREQIIVQIVKHPALEYELASLFWDDAAKCFPGPGFDWDGAWFKLNLQTRKLSVNVGTYPNAFGAYRSDNVDLSAAQFNSIAKQFKMSKELQAYKSDDDWAKLFDDRLNTIVSIVCSELQKRDEERKKAAIKMHSVKIPEQCAKQTPDMCLSEISIYHFQRYSSRSIEVINDNGHYKIVYILRSHTSPQIDSYPRVLSAAESVWLEKQVEKTIYNPDFSTCESLSGGDMMNILIKKDNGKTISYERVKPIRKYSELQNELEHLAEYGSTLCQSADSATV